MTDKINITEDMFGIYKSRTVSLSTGVDYFYQLTIWTTEEQAQQLRNQILDDYHKSRKYESEYKKSEQKIEFDIEVGREPVFTLDSDHDRANYRLVSETFETELECKKVKNLLEEILGKRNE